MADALPPVPLPHPRIDRAISNYEILVENNIGTQIKVAMVDLMKDSLEPKKAYMFCTRRAGERDEFELHSGRGEIHVADVLVRNDERLSGTLLFKETDKKVAVKKLLRHRPAPVDLNDQLAPVDLKDQLFDDFLQGGFHFDDNPYSEISIMQHFGSENHLLPCHEALWDDDFLYIVMPCMEERDLYFKIVEWDDRSRPVSYGEVKMVAWRLAANLRYLANHRLVHCDLKPENVHVNGASYPFFDCAQTKRRSASAELLQVLPNEVDDGYLGGTPGYVSPERSRRQPFNEKADVWAFGCILFYMLTKKRLFDQDDFLSLNRIYRFFITDRGLTRSNLCEQELQRPHLPDDPKFVRINAVQLMEPSARDLLQWCLKEDSAQRPNAEEILRHPFFSRMLRDAGSSHYISRV